MRERNLKDSRATGEVLEYARGAAGELEQWMAGGRTAAEAPGGFPVPPTRLKGERL